MCNYELKFYANKLPGTSSDDLFTSILQYFFSLCWELLMWPHWHAGAASANASVTNRAFLLVAGYITD